MLQHRILAATKQVTNFVVVTRGGCDPRGAKGRLTISTFHRSNCERIRLPPFASLSLSLYFVSPPAYSLFCIFYYLIFYFHLQFNYDFTLFLQI